MDLSPLNTGQGLDVQSWLHPATSFTKLGRTVFPKSCYEKGSAILYPLPPLLIANNGINPGRPSAAKKATARDVPFTCGSF